MTGQNNPPSKLTPPGPKESAIGLFSRAWQARRGPLEFLSGLVNRYGDAVYLGKIKAYVMVHPDHAARILHENHFNYSKGSRYRAAVEPLLGNGLVVSDGSFWLRQRRMLQPAFHRKHHQMIAEVAADSTASLIDSWRERARRGSAVEIHPEMVQLTLGILLKALFGRQSDDDTGHLGRALLSAEHSVSPLSAFMPLRLPGLFPTPRRIRLQKALRVIDDFLFQTIAQRKRNGTASTDVVSLLVKAREEETGEGMSDRQIRDELMTMINAGHETVSDAITWTLYLLASHPESQRKLRDELNGVLNGRAPLPEDLPRLRYLTMVIQEAIRLYPPIWVIGRTAIESDVVGGYPIPSGALIVMSPYVTHRLASFWSNPDEFDPERFSTEACEGRHRFAYFPFGAGPRQCIGAGLALLEAQVVVAMIIQAFHLEPTRGLRAHPKPMVSLQPDVPVAVSIRQVHAFAETAAGAQE